MPKLLQITPDSGLYSCGKICEDIALVAQSQGWVTYVAFGREHKDGVNREIKVGSMLNVYEHYAEQRLFDNEGLASRIPTRKLVNKIKEINPDVIQIHILHDHWLNYRILFKYLSAVKTPVVWTLHDCWPFTGGCFYYDMDNCEKWRTKCENCPQRRALFWDQTEKQFRMKQKIFSETQNLTLVPVSYWLANATANSILKEKKIITIHNGINLSLFKPSPVVKNNKETKEIIGVAALWDRRKGLDDFIKLRSMFPPEYHITLVGLKNEQIERLPEGITGIRKTHNVQELVDLYSKADVFVNTTYSDNFPTTNIEALACGTPIVTYKTGGSPEAICDDLSQIDSNNATFFKTGAVVPQGNLLELVRAIKSITEKQENERFAQRVECRKRAERLFDKNKNFEKYISLYEELLSNNK